jgi:hypothetical protein
VGLAGHGQAPLHTRTYPLDAVNHAMNDGATDDDLDAAL